MELRSCPEVSVIPVTGREGSKRRSSEGGTGRPPVLVIWAAFVTLARGRCLHLRPDFRGPPSSQVRENPNWGSVPRESQPRPTSGIFVAMTVRKRTFASRGRLAM